MTQFNEFHPVVNVRNSRGQQEVLRVPWPVNVERQSACIPVSNEMLRDSESISLDNLHRHWVAERQRRAGLTPGQRAAEDAVEAEREAARKAAYEAARCQHCGAPEDWQYP